MRIVYFFIKPAGIRLFALTSAVIAVMALMLYESVFAPCPPARPKFGIASGRYSVTETGTIGYIQDARADEYAARVGDTLIYINLDKLYLLVYKNGQQVRAFPCSGGRPALPSPYGRWKIIHKDDWGDGFGGYWMGLNVPWGVYGIHGTTEPWVVGSYNASRGCIRLYSEDAEELYKMTPYGATVIIENGNTPFRVMEDGMVGSDIRDAQIMLKALGMYRGSIDGGFGENMFKGVVEFQRKNGLPVTGTIDQATLDMLKKLYDEEPLE